MMSTENSPSVNESLKNQNLEAPIAAVTVYSDRAQIVRRAKAQLESGARELVLENLPATLDLDSLRARGSGEVAVKITGVESREVFLTQENHEAARAAQRELDAAQDEGTALAREDEVLTQRLGTIKEMAESAARRYARSLADGRASLQAAGELLDFLQAQSTQVHQQRAALELKKRDNAARQAALQNRLQQLEGARTKKAQHVVVAVESSGAGDWNLELSYVVSGASWKPLYDARILLLPPSSPEGELEGKLHLSYLASITQNTGEDWQDAALTLSTARPSLGSLPPKLEPIYVDERRAVMAAAPMAAAPSMMRRQISSGLAPDAGQAAPPVPIEAEIETAEIKSEGATVTFELPRRLSVPSDGQPHRANIANHQFPVKLDYFAVPRRSEWAYLRATIRNESTLSLLAGETNIFRDEMFVGITPMEAVAPGAEWKLFLGPDEQVKAKRELTRRDVEKNLIGNVRRINYGQKIEVENLKSHRVSLVVLDQIPISRHEQIKVKLKHAQPEPHTDDMGILRWEQVLPAQAKRELHYEMTVEAPREMTVTGLSE